MNKIGKKVTIMHHFKTKRILSLMIICILISSFLVVNAEYAPDDSTSFYVSNDGSDSNSGTSISSPWRTIGKVNSEFGNAIGVGDDVYFKRGDTFTDTFLNVQISGESQSNPTIFGAYGTGALPKIRGSTYGIYVYNGKEYITIQNLWIEDTSNVGIYLYENINNVIVENCEIHNTGSTGGIWVRSSCGHIFFRDNTLSNNAGDSVLFQGATYSLIENNEIEGGTMNTHSTLVVRSSSYVIVRYNTIFDPNPTHWGGNSGDAAQFLYATDHCIFENNIIYDTDGAGFKIQGGNKHIIRNNQISDCLSYGMGAYTNSGTQSDIHDNTWYHNTIYNCGSGDYMDASFRFVAFSTGNDDIRDNIIKNNILYKCSLATRVVYIDGDPGCEYHVHDNTFNNNILYDNSVNADVCFIDGSATYSVSEVESTFPSEFINNIQLDPKLNGDFTLQSNSPCIDAADWLTTCNGGGSGTQISVHDAGYFCDGYGIIDGDDITVGTDDVTVTDVNYGTNIITITPSITWANNDPVSLTYKGNAPDIGAYEFVSSGPDTTPPQISNIIITESNPLDTDPSFGWVRIACDVTDNSDVDEVFLGITYPDESYVQVSMISGAGNSYYYQSSTMCSDYGDYSFVISANDINNNVDTSSNYNFLMPPNWDIDMNGVCNLLDLTLISSSYGEEGQNGWMREDMDNNGIIQVLDLAIICSHYSETW